MFEGLVTCGCVHSWGFGDQKYILIFNIPIIFTELCKGIEKTVSLYYGTAYIA